MALSANKTNILIVGASGKLGSLIAKHALERPELSVNILVRDPTKDKELTEAVEKAGGRVFKGDVTQPETLIEATKNVHTVVSAINSTDDKIAVDGQVNLLNASIKNGVKRFVPSDFGVNYTHFSREELGRTAIVSPKLTPFAPKKSLRERVSTFLSLALIPRAFSIGLKFQEQLDRTSITQLHFNQGSIIETFFQLQGQGFGYWGEDSFRLNLTSYDDIARAVAAGVARPDLSGSITFVGESLSFKEIAEVYNKVRSTNIQPKQNGSIDVLKGLYEEKRKSGEFLAEIFGLLLLISDKRSTFEKTSNADLPEVTPTSFAEFLKQHPELNLA